MAHTYGNDHLRGADDHLRAAKAALEDLKAPKPGSVRPISVRLPSGAKPALRPAHRLADDDFSAMADSTAPGDRVDHARLADTLVDPASLPDGVRSWRELPDADHDQLFDAVERLAHRYLEDRAASEPKAQQKMLKARHYASTAASPGLEPMLEKAARERARQEWVGAVDLVTITSSVDQLNKRAAVDREDERFAAECREKAARLRRVAETTDDYVASREYLVKAAQLERDAVQGKAVAEQRQADAERSERETDGRLVNRWRWEGDHR